MQGLFVDLSSENSKVPHHLRVACDVFFTHVIALYIISLYFLLLSQAIAKNHNT